MKGHGKPQPPLKATEREVPGWFSLLLVGGAFAALYWLERRRPLRESVESKVRRTGRNLAVAGLSAAAIHWAERPLVGPMTRLVERRRWGLLKSVRLPAWLEIPLAVLL